MRKDVSKLLILGHMSQRAPFLKRAQAEGLLEFVDMDHKKAGFSKEVSEYIRALKILKRFEGDHCLSYRDSKKDENASLKKKPSVLAKKTGQELAQCILDTDSETIRLIEKKKILEAEYKRARHFGHFEKQDIIDIESNSAVRFQFFLRKRGCKHPLPEGILIEVGQDRDASYFVGLFEKPIEDPGLIPIYIERTAFELEKRLKEIKESLNLLHMTFHELVHCLDKIQKDLLSKLNSDDFTHANNALKPEMEERLFVAEVWIDSTKVEGLNVWAAPFDLYIEELPISPDDKVPTILENKNLGKIGEDLVEVYDVPSAQDKDPSLWVLVAFSAFFAMILADAGYGLILLGLSLFLRFKFKKVSDKVKRFFRLLTILSCTTVIWGLLSASIFGINFAPDSPIQRFSVIHWFCVKKAGYHMRMKDDVYKEWLHKYPKLSEVKDPSEALEVCHRRLASGDIRYEMQEEFAQNALMELAILIGLTHICLSLVRYVRRNPSAIGWTLFLIGGYLFFPSLINVTTFVYSILGLSIPLMAAAGLWILIGGVGLAWGLAIWKEKWAGLAEITKGLQLFADVLSYLRLYALALAGMILASTFNDLGYQMGPIFGPVVILLGHIINLSMAVMAAVIHGLRLNFLEFYHYCFDGEGRLFSPLRIRK